MKTEHSRKILVLKRLQLVTITTNFISVIVGWTSEDSESVTSKYLLLLRKCMVIERRMVN